MIRASRALVLLVIAGIALRAQQAPDKLDLLNLTNSVQAAIDAGDWRKAADLSALLETAVRDARNQAAVGKNSALVDSILTWLPADTETVVVAQEPFRISAPDPSAIPSALAMAQGYVTGVLDAAEAGQLGSALQGETIQLAVLGARRFTNHPPDEQNILPLGMIAYQGCGVYVLAKAASKIVARPPDESVMGLPVWVAKGSQNDRPNTDTYLVALPRPDLILVCNDRTFFAEISSRMASPQTPRALPSDLPEWKRVDRSEPLWAIRHFADSADAGNIFGAERDPQATGLVLEFGLAGGAAKARMISKSDPWKDFTSHAEFGGAAQSREVTKGVWELSIGSKPEAAGMAAFALMALAGFVVLL